MPAEIPITAFNGTNLDGTTVYDAFFPSGSDAGYQSQVNLVQLAGRTPYRDTITYGERQLEFQVWKRNNSVADDVFHTNVHGLFRPFAGVRTLTVLHPDGVTSINLDVDIIEFKAIENEEAYQGMFLAVDPVWRATTDITATTSPITIAGNMDAQPVISYTPTSNCSRWRATITPANERGLGAYPVKLSITGLAADSTNTLVFLAGRSVPFWQGSGYVLLRVDAQSADKPAIVDIYSGTGINNNVTSQAIDLGGMDPDDTTNTSWAINDLSSVDVNPQAACGVFVPSVIAREPNEAAGPTFFQYTYGIVSQSEAVEGSAGYTVGVRTTGPKLPNDADSMTLVAGVGIDKIRGLKRVWNDVGGESFSSQKLSIWSREFDTTVWDLRQADWSQNSTTPVVFTGDISIGTATSIACGVQVLESTNDQIESEISFEPDGTLFLDLVSADCPTIDISDAVDAAVVSGTLTNSTTGQSISLTILCMDAVALSIDTLGGSTGRSIQAASGPVYVQQLTLSDVPRWFALESGDNAWTTSLPGTVSFTYRERWMF